MRTKIGFLFLYILGSGQFSQSQTYQWLNDADNLIPIKNFIPVPKGFVRLPIDEDSFGQWLRFLPVKRDNNIVYLYNGQRKRNQSAQFCVIDLDTGNRNLQQCADTIIRLRAEYLFALGRFDQIHFTFTNGEECSFARWSKGFRPQIEDNKVIWLQTSSANSSYLTFRKYLNVVFAYAGSRSLELELHPKSIQKIRPGDVFIQGGFPGHAMLVVDVAAHPETGQTIFLLLQSYMPAQEAHIVKNPRNLDLSPWFVVSELTSLVTPEWTFQPDQLRSWESPNSTP